MSKYIDAEKLKAEIERRKKQDVTFRERSILIDIETAIASLQQEQPEIDETGKVGKWYNGLIPCWVDAPSTRQAANRYHGQNIVAVHLKDGGFRCCLVDDPKAATFYLPEGVHLVEGWKHRPRMVKRENIVTEIDGKCIDSGSNGCFLNSEFGVLCLPGGTLEFDRRYNIIIEAWDK